MKNLLSVLCIAGVLILQAQVQNVTFTINPSAFDEDEQITITVSDVDPTLWNAGQVDNIYLWAWYLDADGNFGANSPTNGTWENSNESQKLTNNGDGTYSYTLTPDAFFGTTGISQIGMLVKAKDGTGDKKSQDFLQLVGVVNINILNPTANPVIVNSGDDINISVNLNYQGSLDVGAFELYYNEVLHDSGNGFPTYAGTITNVTENGTVRVVGSPLSAPDEGEATFDVIVAPTVTEQAVPSGMLDGINYTSDTSVTLVLDAPEKEFVYLAGSFNNYTRDNAYLMKKDASNDKFWIELTGLTAGEFYTYQYWAYDLDAIANSPSEVKTADPYSIQVLSPFDDPFIPPTTYPNLPVYPDGQEREVTLLQPGATPYNWQVTNFTKPNKEDLVVYEVLIRDFDANQNFQNVIDRIDYFKNLNVNAIELMPVMEFEGNESWGYNTAYHMALDKFYGTPDKFKELVDTCHQNGIAVILDIAFNHAFGRNPYVRLWMDDPDGDGWGGPAANNPYFNELPMHSFNVGNDFNHSSQKTKDHVKRVIQFWIDEYQIDGYRWDLTKGFTQNCGDGTNDGNFNCTNQYQQDRIDVLREYVDHTWSIDPDHYAIFEHLGDASEEVQWADYRLNEGKGIIMWGKMTDPYNQLSMGYSDNSNIEGIGHNSRGFSGKRLIGYPESHDEERLMYKNLQFGNTTNASHNVQNLNVALSRMSAIGAVSLTVPGPKMIWHFGALGMENSIFTCQDGSVNTPDDGTTGDCKLDTKPQPQWTEDWLNNTDRRQIYDDWARINTLKIDEPVFEGDYTITSGNLTPRIDIFNNALPTTQLKHVIVLANFEVTTQSVATNFPFGGTWYDLMDETGNTTINSSVSSISLNAGEFRIYGNQASVLSTDDFQLANALAVYPNPTKTAFYINKTITHLTMYDITGKQVKAVKGAFNKGHAFTINDLAQGLYVLKVKTENGTQLSSKIVKQ